MISTLEIRENMNALKWFRGPSIDTKEARRRCSDLAWERVK